MKIKFTEAIKKCEKSFKSGIETMLEEITGQVNKRHKPRPRKLEKIV